MTDSNKVGTNSRYKLCLLVMLPLLDCRQNCTRNSLKLFAKCAICFQKLTNIRKTQTEWNAIKKDPERLNARLLELKATAKVRKANWQLNLVQSFLAKSKPAMPDVSIIEWLWRFKETFFELKLLQVQKIAVLIFIEFLSRSIVPGSKRSLFHDKSFTHWSSLH